MNLPKQLEALRDIEAWVNYVMLPDAKKHSGYSKPPINPHTLKFASVTEPSHRATFDVCNAQIGKPIYIRGEERTVAGVGIVLDAAGLLGIDLDNVIHRDKNGKRIWTSPEARELWRYVNSYTEQSVSGTGVHILAYGKKPGGICRVSNDDGTEYEMYDSGRYFTLSGKTLTGSPGIAHRDAEIEKVYRFIEERAKKNSITVQPSNSTRGGTGAVIRVTDSDKELWDKMFNSAEGAEIRALYNGDTSAYGNDRSRADFAMCRHLAWWTNGDAARMDSLFRDTKLYSDRRENWGRIANRKENMTYGEATIAAVKAGFKERREFTAEEKKQYAQRLNKRDSDRAYEWDDVISDTTSNYITRK